MSNIMNKLNNIFPNDETIDTVIKYLTTNQLPPDTNEKRFKTKYKQFALKDGKLIYEPLQQIVIKKADIEKSWKLCIKQIQMHLEKELSHCINMSHQNLLT